jgi:hypothetical protein
MVTRVDRRKRSFRITKQNANQVNAFIANRVNQFVTEITNLSEETLLEMAEEIKLAAQEKTPVKTGTLKESAYVASEMTPKGPVAEVGYSQNAEATYAPFVHENLEANHPEGEAKFLENALKENVQRVKDIALDKLKKAVE